MTPIQERLFEPEATRGASRATDPWTARAAAHSMEGPVIRDQQRLVLHAVQVCCRFVDDVTAYEAWDLLHDQGNRIKENVVSKRLGELVEMGLVRLTGATRPGSSHRQQQAYGLTEAGRNAA